MVQEDVRNNRKFKLKILTTTIMNLHIHLPTNLKHFDLLLEWYLLATKDDKEIAAFIMNNYKWEIADDLSPQYNINFSSIRELKKKFWKDVFAKISGIYYWSDNCEYLVPTLEEAKKAYEKFLEFNKIYPPFKARIFTLVTPYVGNKMLEVLSNTLEYLNSLSPKTPIEVVVNDFWTLNLLSKKYTNLKIVMGRLIHKTLKNPLIDTYGYEAHPAGELIKNKSSQEIEILRENLVKNQKEFYASSELSLAIYQDFLKKYNIDNVGIDYMENREKLFDKANYGDSNLDIYYPWAIVFTGRLCDTCGIKNPTKWMYATDEVCPRLCKDYDIFYNIKTTWYFLTQRGNSGFRSQTNLDYLDTSNMWEEYRVVFAPFITV